MKHSWNRFLKCHYVVKKKEIINQMSCGATGYFVQIAFFSFKETYSLHVQLKTLFLLKNMRKSGGKSSIIFNLLTGPANQKVSKSIVFNNVFHHWIVCGVCLFACFKLCSHVTTFMARGKCLLRNSISESIQTSLLFVENCLLNS